MTNLGRLAAEYCRAYSRHGGADLQLAIRVTPSGVRYGVTDHLLPAMSLFCPERFVEAASPSAALESFLRAKLIAAVEKYEATADEEKAARERAEREASEAHEREATHRSAAAKLRLLVAEPSA